MSMTPIVFLISPSTDWTRIMMMNNSNHKRGKTRKLEWRGDSTIRIVSFEKHQFNLLMFYRSTPIQRQKDKIVNSSHSNKVTKQQNLINFQTQSMRSNSDKHFRTRRKPHYGTYLQLSKTNKPRKNQKKC